MYERRDSLFTFVFAGDFSEALVFMANNDMQLFEEGVFKEMLAQMDASTGYLNVANGKSIDLEEKVDFRISPMLLSVRLINNMDGLF